MQYTLHTANSLIADRLSAREKTWEELSWKYIPSGNHVRALFTYVRTDMRGHGKFLLNMYIDMNSHSIVYISHFHPARFEATFNDSF